MLALLAPLLLMAAPAEAQTTAAAATSAQASTPAAAGLFDRDWVLANWALKSFDADGDILLSPAEVQAATAAFRKIADTNGDGRVTPEEFRAGRAFILARY